MSQKNHQPARRLSLFDSICIIVGIVIGSGIYQTTPMIAGLSGRVWQFAAVWVFGGLVALTGSLVYAELATKNPAEGGDFLYLTKAYGRRTGLLFAWIEYWMVRPGNIGMMAFVFASYGCEILKYAAAAFPALGMKAETFVGPIPQTIVAASAAGCIVLLNLLGVRAGKFTQNVLTCIKVGGLLLVAGIGLFIAKAAPAGETVNEDQLDFRLALILAMFTYGGWNEISYVAAEVKNPRRNLVRALVIGVGLIMAVYLVVAFSFVRCLGISGVAASSAVAKDVVENATGATAAAVASVLICLSALGSINGMVFTGSRVYYAVGLNLQHLSWLGIWSKRFDSPVRAMLMQGFITIALIVGFGWYADGFDQLLRFVSPVYWFFAFMVGVSLFVLRWKDQNNNGSFQAPWYPWLPIVFCLSCGVLFESSVEYALMSQSWEAFWSIGFVAAGAIICSLIPLEEENTTSLKR